MVMSEKTDSTNENIYKKSGLVGKALKVFFYAFSILGIFFVILTFSLIKTLGKDKAVIRNVPPKAILVVDFENLYNESRTDDLLMDFAGIKSISYYDLVYSINVAARDDRVKVLVANISNVDLGVAQVQDLREVIKNFAATGKKTVAYSTGFGEFGGGMNSYYLASAFDEIWMQPNSEIGITGISVEVPFFKGLFDKIGVEPEFYTRHEYKNAVASLLNDKFSKEHKEELTRMVDNMFNQMVIDIATDRNVDVKWLTDTIDNAPVFVKDENSTKLVDFVDYHPNLVEKVFKDTSAYPIPLEDYYAYADKIEYDNCDTIAFLVIDGAISSGRSNVKPVGDSIVGSDTIIEQLDHIMRNKETKALIVRIDSPGGSYTASHEIWYAIKKVKEVKKIPVIISMSNYAASGGYLIAMSGDYIFAEESTITGSIGVLGGKVVLSKLWNKLGVNWENIYVGKNAGALTVNRKFNNSEKLAFNKTLDNIYDDFVAKVSEARKIDLDKMDELARGRVWTGNIAKQAGLIDDIGGINKAIVKAREMMGSDKVKVVYYPKRKTMQEKIAEVVNGGITKVEAEKIVGEVGFDLEDLKLLKRFEYDTILIPFKLSM